MQISHEIENFEVFSVSFKIPSSCASGYFYVNASSIVTLTINNNDYIVEYQNGHDFCYGDCTSPSNEVILYSATADNANCISGMATLIEEISNVDDFNEINGDLIDALSSHADLNEQEIIELNLYLSKIKREVQALIDGKETELDKKKDQDKHAYLWIQTQSDVFSVRKDSVEEADEYLALEGENIMGVDFCDIDKAYQLCDENLSNFTIE